MRVRTEAVSKARQVRRREQAEHESRRHRKRHEPIKAKRATRAAPTSAPTSAPGGGNQLELAAARRCLGFIVAVTGALVIRARGMAGGTVQRRRLAGDGRRRGTTGFGLLSAG